jgi:hypothetical protein
MRGRVLSVCGHPDMASQDVEDAVTRACAVGHSLSLNHALAEDACLIALLVGDLTTASAEAGYQLSDFI